MPVTISPPLFIELDRCSWDAPYERDIEGGPYTIAYESSDATSDTLNIQFSHSGPLRFYLTDGTTTIDDPVSIPSRGTFQFMVRVNHGILNDQSDSIIFNGLITTTEESTSTTATKQLAPWYELVTTTPNVVFGSTNNDTKPVNVVFRQVRTVAGNEIRTNVWPEDGFSVTAFDARSEQQVTLSSQGREKNPTRLSLVFDAEQGLAQTPAKFIVKLTNNNIYKDQGGQPLELTLKLSKIPKTNPPPRRGGGGGSGPVDDGDGVDGEELKLGDLNV